MSSGGIGIPVLRAILGSAHKIIAVYTGAAKKSGRGMSLAENEISSIAKQHNLPVFTPISFKNDDTKLQFLNLNADLCVVVSYGLLLPDFVVNNNLGAINLHPSALPRWRGAAPIERALEAGDLHSEICTMFLELGLDTGDVIERFSFNIPGDFTAEDVYNFVNFQGGDMILRAINAIENGTISREMQSNIGVTYAKKIDKSELEIDLESELVEKIFNKIRAFALCGGCFVEIQGERIKILRADIQKMAVNTEDIGRIDENFRMFCKDGIILPKVVQKSGKSAVNIEDFLRGWRWKS